MQRDSVLPIVIAFLLAILIIGGLVFAFRYFLLFNLFSVPYNPYEISYESGEFSGDLSGDELSGDVEEEIVVEEPYYGPSIFSGDSRSVAIMIDNDVEAAWPHAGLNNAYMIYEISVEGGASRLIAFFKDDNLPNCVGPIRSARHYFLNYVQEHDAIYCHFGWSPLAQQNIPKLGINNINGIYDNYYKRLGPDKTWHNAFSDKETIDKFIARKKYRDVQNQGSIISYNRYDTDIESGDVANRVSCKYSGFHETVFEYDEESKTYLISMRNSSNKNRIIEHVEKYTGDRFYTKNILVYEVRHKLLDDPEKKGRIDLFNVGTGSGYYITNGKSMPIKWSKSSSGARTIYTDLEGNEISFNDGITWVEIVPPSDQVASKSIEIS